MLRSLELALSTSTTDVVSRDRSGMPTQRLPNLTSVIDVPQPHGVVVIARSGAAAPRLNATSSTRLSCPTGGLAWCVSVRAFHNGTCAPASPPRSGSSGRDSMLAASPLDRVQTVVRTLLPTDLVTTCKNRRTVRRWPTLLRVQSDILWLL